MTAASSRFFPLGNFINSDKYPRAIVCDAPRVFRIDFGFSVFLPPRLMGLSRVTALTLLLLLSLVLGPRIVRAQVDLSTDLETLRAKYHLPGLSAIVIKGGRVAAEGAVGVRRQGNAQPFLTTDRVTIASCTKFMTSTLAARLVDRGVITWTTRVRDVYDNYTSFNPAFWDATLEQLLAHRAGVESGNTWMGKYSSQLAQQTGSSVQIRRWAAEKALSDPPEVTPGTYLYANQGVTAAAVMLEVMSGKNWETLIQEEVFTPLRMSGTGIGVSYTTNTLPPPGVVGHNLTSITAQPVPYNASSASWMRQYQGSNGAGAFALCSLRDWARFLSIHSLDGAGYLSAASSQKLRTPYTGSTGYALCVYSLSRSWANPGPALSHSGATFGQECEFWMAPAHDLIVAVYTNCWSDDDTVSDAKDETASLLIGRFKDGAPSGPLLDTNATLGFAAAQVTSKENDGSVTLTVTRPFPASASTKIAYVTASETATASSDFEPVEGVLTFAPGEISRTIQIPLVNDSTAEPNERFVVQLYHHPTTAPEDGYVIADAQAFVSIEDDEVAIATDAQPSFGGTATGGGTFARGTEVTVKAVARPGHRFLSWTHEGTVVSTSVNYTFTPDRSLNLVANFVALRTITLGVSPADSGTVTGEGSYAYGSTATVTAEPATGYAFSAWMEADSVVSESAEYTFAVTANRLLEARFVRLVYTISATAEPAQRGSVTGAGNYTHGDSVSLTASPATGYRFTGWTEGGQPVTGTGSYQFTSTGHRNLVANFIAAQAPNTPQNIAPAHGATDQPTDITLQASSFADPFAGATHSASQWFVSQVQDGTVDFDSGETGATTSLTVPVTLQPGTLYRWQVRYKNDVGVWSAYSAPTQFETSQDEVDTFAPYAGTYLGLAQADVPEFATSGSLTVTVTKTGKFTAAFKLGAQKFSLNKTFEADGSFTGSVAVKGIGPLDLRLLLDTSRDLKRVTGTISGAVSPINFLARQAIYSSKEKVPAELVGKYTLLLPASSVAGSPAGTGFGKVTVGATGSVSIQGKLGDGTAYSQSTRLTAGAVWPLYISLYSTTGSIGGWLGLEAKPDTDLDGELDWFKLPIPAAKVKATTLYPTGISSALAVQGARYTPPTSGAPAIALPEATNQATIAWSGNTAPPLLVTWAKNNKVVPPTGTRFSFSLTASTGFFSGSYTFPGETKATKFFGALFQKHAPSEFGRGAGYFLRSNTAETISLSGQP